ncbi:glycosyltransferase [Gemmatimonas phototrophica]|uniref:glycosyltransferase n=1 Tax=Gemmatimonas phototrophica TaxID=1379270 RepID=UPI001314A4CF|nr:glycosyltransferase [Gemmatimonas phototrophica]
MSLPYASQLLTGTAMYFGGAEVRGTTFLNGLAATQAWDVHAVVVGPPAPPMRLANGVTVHTKLEAPCRITVPLATPAETVWGRVAADVYLAFGANEASAEVAHYCRAAQRPLVLSIASDAAFDATVYELSIVCDAYGVVGHFPWYAINGAHTVVVQTDHQQALYRARYGSDAVLIRNPAPQQGHRPPRTAVANGGRMLWVGRVDPNKRYEEALLLAAALPHREMIMVCNNILSLGEGTIDELQTAMPNLMVADQVALPDIEGLFRFSDVLVNTSVVEGFPNTFLQAGLAGIPIVSMVVDPDGMLSQHGCGRVSDGTSAGMAHTVETLLANDNAYAAAATACSAWVHGRHDASARVAELSAVLAQALALSPAGDLATGAAA